MMAYEISTVRTLALTHETQGVHEKESLSVTDRTFIHNLYAASLCTVGKTLTQT